MEVYSENPFSKNSYAEAYLEPTPATIMELFLQKNLTSFSHRTNPPEVFYKNS